MTSSDSPNPRIIIDEDWKSQVEREKAAASGADATPTASNTAAPAASSRSDAPSPADDEDADQLPPASFAFLVSTLATQTMVHLGQIADPIDNKATIRLPLAQHHIDTLAILEEKTRGNLTAEEEKMLTTMLHELRMAFLYVKNLPR